MCGCVYYTHRSLKTVLDTADKHAAKQASANRKQPPPCAFKSADAYVRFFRPLMLLEIQASVAQAAREGHWERNSMVAELLETSVVDQFTLARFRIGRGEGPALFQGDVLLLTHARPKQAGMVHLANATTMLPGGKAESGVYIAVLVKQTPSPREKKTRDFFRSLETLKIAHMELRH